MYQMLQYDYEGSPWFSNWQNLIVKENNNEVDASTPVIVGSDILKPHVRQWLDQGQPAIYIGRGYVGNHMHKTRQLWRYSVNGWANTKLLNVPYSRWPLLNLEKHPWKVTEVKRVLIAPSRMTAWIWDPAHGNGQEWANYMSQQFPGAEVRIRFKMGKAGPRWATLWNDLDWADLVVSQGSAITAEAFWYGKKVISTRPCVTWAAEKSVLADWKNPNEPTLRDAWHEHLAWCQFTNSEWASGEAIKLIESYVGSVMDYTPDHTYNFNSDNIVS
jgi:hypothetical protein